jgi:hypothetical protein
MEVAMKSFERFLSLLARIPDPRRAEGKLYQLPHVLLFSILAIVSGANSCRGIRTFIKVHRQKRSLPQSRENPGAGSEETPLARSSQLDPEIANF